MKTAHKQTTKALESSGYATLPGTTEGGDLAWHCEYTAQDVHLWAPDHLLVREMAVATKMERMGSSALLDIRMDLNDISDEVLQNTIIHIHIRDTFSMTQYAGLARAEDALFVNPEDGLPGFHMSFPIEREVLERLEANGPNSIHLILEDKDGEILDDVIGAIHVRSC